MKEKKLEWVKPVLRDLGAVLTKGDIGPADSQCTPGSTDTSNCYSGGGVRANCGGGGTPA